MTKKTEPQQAQISVSGHNMPVSVPLQTYVVNKMDRLTRYLDRVSRVEVVLSSEHTRVAGSRNLAEGTATLKGRTIRAECADADMYAAIDGLVDKLHLQLTRAKERTQDHRRPSRGTEDLEEEGMVLADVSESERADDSSQSQDRIVEVKQYTLKPMFADEAIEEMEELGHAFFVFLNASNEKVSVVYRRRDGMYGLIEPAFV